MKTFTLLVLLAAVTGGRATDGHQRQLRRGERVQGLLRLAIRLFYSANERVAQLGPGPTVAPAPTDGEESTLERSPVEKKADKKEAKKGAKKEIAVEGAAEAPATLPSDVPSLTPSLAPSDQPSLSPSDAPSISPSNVPSLLPSDLPSVQPTGEIQGFVRCEEAHACNSGGIVADDNDGFWMSKLNRDGVTCETTCMLPVAIPPRKVLGWECGKICV